jgi:endonuclease-3
MRTPSIESERGRRARLVNKRLTSEYGRKVREGTDDPLDTLIETILSQNTSDVNSGRAFEALRKRYPTWPDVLAADQSEIAQTIRSGGLAEIKARRIKHFLSLLAEERGDLSLGFLDGMDASEAERWLTRIEGIGSKTAAIVLLFSLGKPAFPVDTHVFRVSRRIGLTSKTSSREAVQRELERIVDSKEYYNMHINLIEHGRSKCRARRPRCDDCVVSDVCEHHNLAVKGQP